MKRAIAPSAGFAYIEVLVAVLLLALCALPAANAIQNGLAAANAAPTRAKDLRCMRDTMEYVLSRPYAELLAKQNGNSKVDDYSSAKSDDCVERQVYIGVYLKQAGGDPGTANATALLRVDVVSRGTSYAFTTLVAP